MSVPSMTYCFLPLPLKMQSNGVWSWEEGRSSCCCFIFFLLYLWYFCLLPTSQISILCQFSSECFFLLPYFHWCHPSPDAHYLSAGLLQSLPPHPTPRLCDLSPCSLPAYSHHTYLPANTISFSYWRVYSSHILLLLLLLSRFSRVRLCATP